MKLHELFNESIEDDKDVIRSRAKRGRPQIDHLKKLSKATDKDPNRSAKNYEHGFRSAIKRDYKKAVEQK